MPPPRNAADRFIRTFRFPAYILAVLVLYGLGCLALGLSLAPAAWVLYRLGSYGLSLTNWLRWPVVGFSAGLALFVFGFTLLLVVPVLNWVLPTRIRPYKGSYFTLTALPWFVHNGLLYLVRFTVLPFATLTPFGLWFLKGMGMKVGKRAFVDTECISDPRLITLGDDVALGGSVRIVAHYGGGGDLVIAPVVIGNRTTVGPRHHHHGRRHHRLQRHHPPPLRPPPRLAGRRRRDLGRRPRPPHSP